MKITFITSPEGNQVIVEGKAPRNLTVEVLDYPDEVPTDAEALGMVKDDEGDWCWRTTHIEPKSTHT